MVELWTENVVVQGMVDDCIFQHQRRLYQWQSNAKADWARCFTFICIVAECGRINGITGSNILKPGFCSPQTKASTFCTVQAYCALRGLRCQLVNWC